MHIGSHNNYYSVIHVLFGIIKINPLSNHGAHFIALTFFFGGGGIRLRYFKHDLIFSAAIFVDEDDDDVKTLSLNDI
jgi:hypothetical protein